MVTSIKFSSDFKYFISGDADGVICHYVRTAIEEQIELKGDTGQQDQQQQLIQNQQMTASVLQTNNQATMKGLPSGFEA
jgi:hypothetical protein